jgi:hypothetical protein
MIDLFEQGNLLGLREFHPLRFPAGPAEAATVLGATLAVMAIRAFFSSPASRTIGRSTDCFKGY